jgi:SAM-dependent methyltransferase
VFNVLKKRWRHRVSARSASTLHREAIKMDWNEHDYYENAEAELWIAPFWAVDSPFRRQFEQLDLTCVIEIGCGRGRHAMQFVDRVGRLYLTDINQSNIEACRGRYAGRANVICLQTAGNSLSGIADNEATGVFSYDAMVHFEATDVLSYITEIRRVLQMGGRALLHYSNFDENPCGFYRDNPGHRNFFSERIMRHFADRAGFSIRQNLVFAWPLGNQDLPTDGLILLQKTR